MALLSGCATLWGQNAVVSGRVTDSSGAVIPGASVELQNIATGVRVKSQTNAEGLFVFPPASPGGYEVSVAAAGFSTAQIKGMNLEVGQSRTVNVTLTPSAVSESVTVSESTPLLTRTAPTAARWWKTSSFKHPAEYPQSSLAGDTNRRSRPRQWPHPGDNTASQAQTNEFRINGGRSSTSEILIDGAANTGTYNNQVSAIPQVDAVQEFKVNTNPYDAEFGHTGGGVISYTIKSGTKAFHGNLHEYFQNYHLDANGFNANKAKPAKSGRRKNQYGFTLGGPLMIPKLYNGRNRTFFFFAYEGLRQSSYYSYTNTVPTALQRQGDFSQTFDTNGALKVIYDPYTTRLDPTAPPEPPATSAIHSPET